MNSTRMSQNGLIWLRQIKVHRGHKTIRRFRAYYSLCAPNETLVKWAWKLIWKTKSPPSPSPPPPKKKGLLFSWLTLHEASSPKKTSSVEKFTLSTDSSCVVETNRSPSSLNNSHRHMKHVHLSFWAKMGYARQQGELKMLELMEGRKINQESVEDDRCLHFWHLDRRNNRCFEVTSSPSYILKASNLTTLCSNFSSVDSPEAFLEFVSSLTLDQSFVDRANNDFYFSMLCKFCISLMPSMKSIIFEKTLTRFRELGNV